MRTITAFCEKIRTFEAPEVLMEEKRLSVGAKLVVSTSDGEEEDEVTRVLVDAVDAGVWVVETARNGRVIVMRGRDEGYRDSYQITDIG